MLSQLAYITNQGPEIFQVLILHFILKLNEEHDEIWKLRTIFHLQLRRLWLKGLSLLSAARWQPARSTQSMWPWWRETPVDGDSFEFLAVDLQSSCWQVATFSSSSRRLIRFSSIRDDVTETSCKFVCHVVGFDTYWFFFLRMLTIVCNVLSSRRCTWKRWMVHKWKKALDVVSGHETVHCAVFFWTHFCHCFVSLLLIFLLTLSVVYFSQYFCHPVPWKKGINFYL